MQNKPTALCDSLYLIQRITDLGKDPLIKAVPWGRIGNVPDDYETLTAQLGEFLLAEEPNYSYETVKSRFQALENAGFHPFWSDGRLSLKTPKGVLTIY